MYSTGRDQQTDIRLDELDEKILWELVKDARISNSALAAKLGVAPSTTLLRVRAMRANGALIGANALPDLRAVGLPIQAMISVRLRGQARAELKTYAQKVMRFPQVLSAYSLGGAEDFLVHVACTSPEHLRDFVSAYFSADPRVDSTQTSLVFEAFHGALFMDEIDGFQAMRAKIEGVR